MPLVAQMSVTSDAPSTNHDLLPNGQHSSESQYVPEASPSVVVEAVGRRKLLVLLLGLVLAAVGVAGGLTRKPVWTARSTLQIGSKLNPNSPAFYSFVQSTTNLATTLSRTVDATGVIRSIQKDTNLDPISITKRITATPVPAGAAIDVLATGPTQSSAIRLANAASAAMVRYEAHANSSAGTASAVYVALRRQADVVANAQAAVRHLRAVQQLKTTADGTNPSTRESPALVMANAALGAAQARATALGNAYTQALEQQPSGDTLVTPLTRAFTATSDRTKKIELFGFAGLAGGILIASAIATLLEQRRRERSMRHP